MISPYTDYEHQYDVHYRRMVLGYFRVDCLTVFQRPEQRFHLAATNTCQKCYHCCNFNLVYFLLYFGRAENKRKTRYVPKTLTPEWNQTLIYRNIHPIELGAKILEITVWDFDRFTFNDFMGQVGVINFFIKN